MRGIKTGLLAIAAICIMGADIDAQACGVRGTIVCTTDNSIGVSGVVVTLTNTANQTTFQTNPSAADGSFSTRISGDSTYSLSPGGAIASCTTEDAYVNGIDVGQIEVFDEEQCPGTTTCPVTYPREFPACLDRPLGNPRAECAYFGLDVLDKNDNVSSPTATASARIAIVKAGSCYDVFENVVEGVTELSSSYPYAISHVTYCECPAE